jgi:hypothetical protein
MTATPVMADVSPRAAPFVSEASRACELPIAICEQFVADILKPYRPNAKYLKSGQITQFRDASDSSARRVPVVTAAGKFSIPESCYIDDTGHFNAVEFNICYNQLAYAMFGKCFDTGIVPRLRFLTLGEYKEHQLQSCFIVSLESRFFKQLKGGDFRGELVVNKMSTAGGATFCFTSIRFSDCEGVKAQGEVVLAFNPPASSATH